MMKKTSRTSSGWVMLFRSIELVDEGGRDGRGDRWEKG